MNPFDIGTGRSWKRTDWKAFIYVVLGLLIGGFSADHEPMASLLPVLLGT